MAMAPHITLDNYMIEAHDVHRYMDTRITRRWFMATVAALDVWTVSRPTSARAACTAARCDACRHSALVRVDADGPRMRFCFNLDAKAGACIVGFVGPDALCSLFQGKQRG